MNYEHKPELPKKLRKYLKKELTKYGQIYKKDHPEIHFID